MMRIVASGIFVHISCTRHEGCKRFIIFKFHKKKNKSVWLSGRPVKKKKNIYYNRIAREIVILTNSVSEFSERISKPIFFSFTHTTYNKFTNCVNHFVRFHMCTGLLIYAFYGIHHSLEGGKFKNGKEEESKHNTKEVIATRFWKVRPWRKAIFNL